MGLALENPLGVRCGATWPKLGQENDTANTKSYKKRKIPKIHCPAIEVTCGNDKKHICHLHRTSLTSNVKGRGSMTILQHISEDNQPLSNSQDLCMIIYEEHRFTSFP